MAENVGVRTPSELMRLLEESRILDDGPLRIARQMVPETSTSKMFARRLVAKGVLTRWQAGQLLVGYKKLRLGNHRLCGQIGRGAYGRVFLAEHIQLKREVAIKTLSRRFTQRKEIVERFLEDARRVAMLNHRNLVHVLDIDSDDDQYFLVMEYVVGRDLQRLVAQNGPLPFSVAADYLIQAADGLAHAHAAGVVHRDLCPANLMLDDKGAVKISGMGVGQLAVVGHDRAAKESAADQEQTGNEQDHVAAYRSPEQLLGKTKGDVSSDIFSLGATAVYLLSGHPPVRQAVADSGEALESDGNLLRSRPDTPPALASLIARMMALEPIQRFGTVLEVREAWSDWLSEMLTDSQPEPAPGGFEPAPRAKVTPPPIPLDQVPSIRDVPSRASRSSDILGDDSTSPVSRERLLGDRRYVLGGAALAGLMLVALAGYAWWPGPRVEIASPGDTSPTVKERLAVPKLRPSRRAERGSGKTSRNDLAASVPSAGSGSDTGPASNPLAGIGGIEEMPVEPGATPAVPGGSGEVSSPETSEPSPGTSPLPAATSPPSGAAETPPAKKTSAETVADAPMDATVDPFQALPAAVDLPTLLQMHPDSSDYREHSLAAFPQEAMQEVTVSLLGGDHAAGKAGRFIVRPVSTDSEGTWQIVLLDGRDDGREQPLGDLSLRDGQILFRWTPSAPQFLAAPQLCNCVVRFTWRESKHDLRLRTPRQVGPMKIDLTRPEVNERWPIEMLPDAQQTRFEIARLEPTLPVAHSVEPAEAVGVGAEAATLLFGETPADRVLELVLEPELKGGFRLECQAFFRVSPKLDRIPLTAKKLETATSFVANRQVRHNLVAQQLRAAIAQVPATDPRHNQLTQNLQRAEAELAETTQAIERLATLQQLRQAFSEGGAIHFRLFYLADDCEVDLVQSSPTAQ